jgi:hypothetical protein
MVISEKRDHLSGLWTSGPGVSREEGARQLREVLLVQENMDLWWLWGSVDCTGKVPDDISDLLRSAILFHKRSIGDYSKLLDP